MSAEKEPIVDIVGDLEAKESILKLLQDTMQPVLGDEIVTRSS